MGDGGHLGLIFWDYLYSCNIEWTTSHLVTYAKGQSGSWVTRAMSGNTGEARDHGLSVNDDDHNSSGTAALLDQAFCRSE